MRVSLVIICCLSLVMLGCQPVENSARDTSAALGGLLATAQTQNQQTCQAQPTQTVCVLINKGIAAQAALITATEAYCGWTVGVVPGDPNAKCVPVKSAVQGLQAAIDNAKPFIAQLKGVLH